MNVNGIIKQFVCFINNSYKGLNELFLALENEKKDIILADKIENGFYQFIWEIIVESQLCSNKEYLEPYGDGADFYGTSSRVIYPDKLAGKKISINVTDREDRFSKKNVKMQNLDFIKFVNYNEGKYSVSEPFDFVLCEDNLGNQLLFKFDEVDYLIIRIDE